MKKTVLSFILCLLSLSNYYLFSQPITEWVQRYNSPGNYDDYVNDMVVDKSGNVYLAGYIKISETNYDFITIKYLSNGTLHWAKTYDVIHDDDKAKFIGIDSSGNVYVTGQSDYMTNPTTRTAILTIKYSPNGDLLWTRRYINTDSIYALPEAMVVDDSGNCFVTGDCSVSGHSSDYITIKYNTVGDIAWLKFLNGSANAADIPYGITLDKNKNIYVTGQGREPPGITIVNKTVKYDKNGNQKWVKDYFGLGTVAEVGKKICVDDSGYVYVGGYGDEGNQANYDFRLLKYDSLGTLIWMRHYNSRLEYPNNDYIKDMTLDKNSNIFVTGTCPYEQTINCDFTTIKYNSLGDSLWVKRFDINLGGSDEYVNSITSDKYGNIYLTGYSDRAFISYKYATIKYNNNGVLQWSVFYDNNLPNSNHYGVKVSTDTLGNIYVTGYSQGTGTGYDITTIKYSDLTNIQKSTNDIPKEFKLCQNYPNPFNPITNIRYDIPKNIFVTIKIYDLLGREIKTLVNEFKNAGSYLVSFNASEFASGIYFYRIQSGSFIQVKRMVLIK
jgi:uncharacterized delta-60 repeat protein